jgi:hypothetical protein
MTEMMTVGTRRQLSRRIEKLESEPVFRDILLELYEIARLIEAAKVDCAYVERVGSMPSQADAALITLWGFQQRQKVAA